MPKTENNVELEILRELFSAEEAEMALYLRVFPESIEEIANRIDKEVEVVSTVISNMANKGLIFWSGEGKNRKYRLMSFYPGILELQYKRLGKELAGKIGKYLDTSLTEELIGAKDTQLFRVVPINKKVPHQLYVFPYDKVANIIDSTDFICMTECFCRKNKDAAGEACGAPTDTCLVFGDYAKMFVDNGLGDPISKEKAMDILERSEDEGLIHCTFNTARDNLVVCNCCGCCCSILRGVTRLNIPTAVVKSDYDLSVDQNRCTGCGTCIERCHLKAVSIENNRAMTDHDRCIGCGVCILTCLADARRLVRKSPEERVLPIESPDVALEKLSRERNKKALLL